MFMVIIAIHAVFFKQLTLVINLLFTVLLVVALLVFEYYYEDDFTNLSSIYTREELYIDVVIGFCTASLLLYVIIHLIKRGHDTLIQSLTQKRQMMEEDLILARNLQKQILEYKKEDVTGFDFAVKVMPSLELGGDLFDISRPRKEFLRFFIADAQGHGVNAALSSMLIKSSWVNLNAEELSPAQMLQKINSKIISSYGDSLAFTAAVCDIYKNKIIFSSSGHPPQYLIQEGALLALENSGPPIGMFENIEYADREYKISPSSRLLFYTDALVEEVETKKNDLKGQSWLEDKLEHTNQTSEHYMQYLINEFAQKLKMEASQLSLTDDLMVASIRLDPT